MMSRKLLRAARVLLPAGFAAAGIVIEDGWITEIQPFDTDAAGSETLADDLILSPGLIDTQVNGGGGHLFNASPDAKTIAAIGAAHRRLGVTGFLPTLITDAPQTMRQAGLALAAAQSPSVLGLHLEGPFLSPAKAGIHHPGHIRSITEDDIAFLCALAAAHLSRRLLLTLAPEETDDASLARLTEAGILLAAGHCMASPDRIASACRHGLRGMTHLFNAMPPIASRAPGPVAAALMAPDLWCGIIADGIHVDPLLLQFTLRCKPQGKLFLVSDAMPPAATDTDGFDLYEKRIHRRNGRLMNDTGTLAGADLSLPQAIKNMCDLGVTLDEALRMASTYPADFLDLPHLGRIAPGCRADFTLFSAALDIRGTWVQGIWQAAA